MKLFSFFFFLSLLSPGLAQAFPELTRHGYTNCKACHELPQGGNLLNDYGRALSKDLLSTFSKDGEEALLYGAVTPPAWLNFGGDVRYLYLYQNNPSFEEGKSLAMQADGDAILKYKEHWRIHGTIGAVQADVGGKSTAQFLSRRHGVEYVVDDHYSIYAGKSAVIYGLNIPEHAIFTKQGLGWDDGSETYNVQVSRVNGDWNSFLTLSDGNRIQQNGNREMGFAFQESYAITDSSRVGLNYFRGFLTGQQKRDVFGPIGTIGFTDRLFLLSEFDWQVQDTRERGGSIQHGFASFQRVGYEITQGVIALVTRDDAHFNINDPMSPAHDVGLGLQWFPRPHFELQAQWYFNSSPAQFGGQNTDLAYLLAHFYL